jgi:hypothetical protein
MPDSWSAADDWVIGPCTFVCGMWGRGCCLGVPCLIAAPHSTPAPLCHTSSGLHAVTFENPLTRTKTRRSALFAFLEHTPSTLQEAVVQLYDAPPGSPRALPFGWGIAVASEVRCTAGLQSFKKERRWGRGEPEEQVEL